MRLAGSLLALEDAFENLKTHGINVGIKCTQPSTDPLCPRLGEEPADLSPWGYEKVCDALGYRGGCMRKQYDDYQAYNIILEAMAAARLAPAVLELGNTKEGVPIERVCRLWLLPLLEASGFKGDEFRAAMQTAHYTEAMHQCIKNGPFANLETLRLTLTLGPWWADEWRWPLEKARVETDICNFQIALLMALHNAPNLRTLSLTILPHLHDEECLGRPPFQALNPVHKSALPNLRNLELEGHVITEFELHYFCNNRSGTLKRLDLRYIKSAPSPCPEGRWDSPFLDDGTEKSAFWLDMFKTQILPKSKITWEHVYDGATWDHRLYGS